MGYVLATERWQSGDVGNLHNVHTGAGHNAETPKYYRPMNQPSAQARPLYFVSAPVDFAMIGGLSIVTFLGLYLPGGSSPLGRETRLVLAAALAWVVNWPHFSATSYRLYHSAANIRQYPITALVVPLLLAIGGLGSFASPTGVAPWLVKLFVIWSPYHFSGQTVGITLIYARRAGFSVGRGSGWRSPGSSSPPSSCRPR